MIEQGRVVFSEHFLCQVKGFHGCQPVKGIVDDLADAWVGGADVPRQAAGDGIAIDFFPELRKQPPRGIEQQERAIGVGGG